MLFCQQSHFFQWSALHYDILLSIHKYIFFEQNDYAKNKNKKWQIKKTETNAWTHRQTLIILLEHTMEN